MLRDFCGFLVSFWLWRWTWHQSTPESCQERPGMVRTWAIQTQTMNCDLSQRRSKKTTASIFESFFLTWCGMRVTVTYMLPECNCHQRPALSQVSSQRIQTPNSHLFRDSGKFIFLYHGWGDWPCRSHNWWKMIIPSDFLMSALCIRLFPDSKIEPFSFTVFFWVPTLCHTQIH